MCFSVFSELIFEESEALLCLWTYALFVLFWNIQGKRKYNSLLRNKLTAAGKELVPGRASRLFHTLMLALRKMASGRRAQHHIHCTRNHSPPPVTSRNTSCLTLSHSHSGALARNQSRPPTLFVTSPLTTSNLQTRKMKKDCPTSKRKKKSKEDVRSFLWYHVAFFFKQPFR